MRTQAFIVSILVVTLASLLVLTVAAQGTEPPGVSPTSLVTPTPPVPVSPPHVPYDPFRRWNTLPTYPSKPRAPRPQPQISLTKPAGIDLDVVYISRTPMYNRYEVWYTADGTPYLRPG
ncbi:MAG: hypothetical protein ACPL4I_11360 [Bacteroidota bacterium]